ncbi:MAG: glycosyltransferase family 4 protein [Pirellulales bacterium]|nr:glycosyltransferase family 4 protein [Pirellulales bacterium]
MRILYVSQYFPPEMGAPSARVYDMARNWVAQGHEVTVLTAFAHHPVGVKAPEDRGVITRRETVDGIDVVRTYVYAAPNRGIARRMLSYASFMMSATAIGFFRVRRPDVVIATSPQLLCGVAGYLLACLLRRPFVFEVRDLWPESILATAVVQRENAFIRALKAVARHLYRRCDRIVAVGEGYATGIHALYGIDPGKMSIIHNGIDASLFRPGPRDNDVRREYGWGDKFVALYLGTHGLAHGLESVLRAARTMRDDPNTLFVLVGEGAEKDRLKALAAEWGLPNVQFIDQQPRRRVVDFYAACDVGVVCLRDAPRFQEVLPSKIFEYFGMERPIVLGVSGEAAKLVRRADAGVCVPPEDSDALVAAIQQLADAPRQLEEMGRRGRAFVLKHFNRAELAAKYVRVLDAVIQRGEAPAESAFTIGRPACGNGPDG